MQTEKGKTMRLIDADELEHMLRTDFDTLYETIFETIRRVPTIDAVPVVRCKDCRYSDDYYNDGSCYCKHPEHEMRYIGKNWNWYCADGERKEKE